MTSGTITSNHLQSEADWSVRHLLYFYLFSFYLFSFTRTGVARDCQRLMPHCEILYKVIADNRVKRKKRDSATVPATLGEHDGAVCGV